MKKILLIVCIAFAGCGAKTNEDIAKELITESLKAKLPDFNDYESVNFGTMGKAFLPFEETGLFVTITQAIKSYQDSVNILQQSADAATSNIVKESILRLQDSIKAKSEIIAASKRVYTPEELFKITHGYTLKDKTGKPVPVEEAYYFDKDFKGIVKVKKVF